jgi:hypothetical protein
MLREAIYLHKSQKYRALLIKFVKSSLKVSDSLQVFFTLTSPQSKLHKYVLQSLKFKTV